MNLRRKWRNAALVLPLLLGGCGEAPVKAKPVHENPIFRERHLLAGMDFGQPYNEFKNSPLWRCDDSVEGIWRCTRDTTYAGVPVTITLAFEARIGALVAAAVEGQLIDFNTVLTHVARNFHLKSLETDNGEEERFQCGRWSVSDEVERVEQGDWEAGESFLFTQQCPPKSNPNEEPQTLEVLVSKEKYSYQLAFVRKELLLHLSLWLGALDMLPEEERGRYPQSYDELINGDI